MNLNGVEGIANRSSTDQPSTVDSENYHPHSTALSSDRASSASPENDWVSPFTVLPPLPALRKPRGQSNHLRSPEERLHQRSASSAYYAAAWGSPYATPSPAQTPPPARSRREGHGVDLTSPLASRDGNHSSDLLEEQTVRARSKKNLDDGPRPPRASSWDPQRSLSEKFNWLSESEHSGSEKGYLAGKTPTKSAVRKEEARTIYHPAGLSATRGHHLEDSVTTITPDIFNATADPIVKIDHSVGQQSAMDLTVDPCEQRPGSNSIEKPLPSLPPTTQNVTEADPASIDAHGPESPVRPRIMSTQSFQRPKKKVPWKGRTCVIALPMTDRDEAGLPPVLSAAEIKQRMQKWAEDGYSLDGFTLTESSDTYSQSPGQSRALYPDPVEMYAERKNGKLHVHIPNQAEWDAWVNYLKEEKLRALGVTPSNSEAPVSTQSPFSSTLSRVSSVFPSIAASSPAGGHSVNGTSVRMSSNTFSPPLSHPGPLSSQGGSHVASPLGAMHMPGHKYNQSVAFVTGHPRVGSPFDFPMPQPNPYGPNGRQSAGYFGLRQFSPPAIQNVQSLGQVLSPLNAPTSPMLPIPSIPSNGNGSGTPTNPTMDQIRMQQQRRQEIHAQVLQKQGQHQRHYSMFPQPSRSADLPRTPGIPLGSPTRSTPEIMHPTPRSHRHNLSAALQKGVDEAEAARGAEVSAALNNMLQIEPVRSKSVGQEEMDEQDELPVLKRPETLLETEEKSDIETNPSIAASPMLMDEDKTSMTNLDDKASTAPPIVPPAPTASTVFGHKAKPSLSAFNVKAPEFNPGKVFSFTPVVAQATFVPSHSSRPSLIQSKHTSKNPSVSSFNVEAPAFTPSFLKQSTPQSSAQSTPAKKIETPGKSQFTFGLSTFNAAAPEFKPGQSFSFNAPEFVPGRITSFGSANGMAEGMQSRNVSSGSIFGNVVIDPTSKSMRRSAKGVPIIKPRSRSGTPADSVEAEDEGGRLRAPTDRQKRARRAGSDDEDGLAFADSAPFDHAEGLSTEPKPVAENREATLPVLEEDVPLDEVEVGPERTANEQVSQPVQTDNAKLPEKKAVDEPERQPKLDTAAESAELSENESDNGEPGPELREESPDIVEVPSDRLRIATNDASVTDISGENLPTDGEGSKSLEASPIPEQTQTAAQMKQLDETTKKNGSEDRALIASDSIEADTSAAEPKVQVPSHKAKSSLSALAPPFEFKPTSFAPPAESSGLRKSSGLAASKFASSSPPPALTLQASRFGPQATFTPSKQPPAIQAVAEEKTSSPVPSSEVKFEIPSERSNVHHAQHDSAGPELLYGEVEPEKSPAQSLDENRLAISDPVASIEAPSYIDHPAEEAQSTREITQAKETVPSYEEIDAVMKQFEDNPDLGVERDGTPIKETPLIDMRLPPNMRSDAPSPSPQLLHKDFQQFSPPRRMDYGLGIHKLNDSNGEVSDWGNDYSPQQEQTLQARAGFFDEHVSELVDGLFENRLGPVERSLSIIQRSISLIATRPADQTRRNASSDKRDSDADDEDEYDGYVQYRSRSPNKRDKKSDYIRNAVLEAMASYRPAPQESATGLAEINAVLSEMRQLSQQMQQQPSQPDLKVLIEDVIDSQSQAQPAPVNTEREAAYDAEREKLKSAADAAEKRADAERVQREQMEQELRQLRSKLQDTQHEVQSTVKAFTLEKEAYRSLEVQFKAAEDLNAEYRLTKNSLDEELSAERLRNQDLAHTLRMVRIEHEDQHEVRSALRNQIEGLKDRMVKVMHDFADDESEWREEEQQLAVQNQKIQAALDHEVRHRQSAENQLRDLDVDHKENLRFRVMHEQAQQEVARLHAEIAQLREDNRKLEGDSFKLERELTHAKNVVDAEVANATAKTTAELKTANVLGSDFEAQIGRLQSRLDNAEIDLEDQKAKHDSIVAEMTDTHNQALHESNEKRETSLQEQHSVHERKLNELRERHTRALHNSSDDRHRLEYQFNEKLTFSEDKVKHLEGKVADLEERLEITKSAARAAVEAATSKKVDVPTPASSVAAASPPHHSYSASIPLIRGTDVPEKISPQALRESIMVLQEQLQNREQVVEQLEQQLAAIDKDAPSKLKERETEVTMLRELLAVRVDDLEEIISTLSRPDFDRNAAKDAAIRLKANLQMEQQLKERAIAANEASDSSGLSSITNIASPRAIPMAAAAAWGNWRKARDSSISALGNIASTLADQTPSRSTSSPSKFMAGMMTPTSTSHRSSPSKGLVLTPPSMRPLNTARKSTTSGGPTPRPLRPYSSQPRTMSSQSMKRRESNESTGSVKHHEVESPKTPTTMAGGSPIAKEMNFDDDVDEDASVLDSDEHQHSDSVIHSTSLSSEVEAAEA